MIGRGRGIARARPPWGLVGMIALVAAVESFVARHDDDFSNNFAADWKMTGRVARKQVADCEVLCFGDSLVKNGVVARILEERLGLRAYNLALGGGQAPASYFLLRRALESGARPKALLVDFIPVQLLRGPRFNSRVWPELLTAAEAADLAREGRDAGFFAHVMLARALPSIRDRGDIRRNVLAALRGESASTRTFVPLFRYLVRRDRGSLIAERNDHPTPARELVPWIYPDRKAVEPMNLAYVRRFLDLAAEHDIPVFWLLTPIDPEIQAAGERGGEAEKAEGFVRALQASYPALTVIDGRRAGYASSVFWDPVHLNRRGAAIFTTELAEVLAERLPGGSPGPRWVRVPPFRDREIDLPAPVSPPTATAARDHPEGRRR